MFRGKVMESSIGVGKQRIGSKYKVSNSNRIPLKDYDESMRGLEKLLMRDKKLKEHRLLYFIIGLVLLWVCIHVYSLSGVSNSLVYAITYLISAGGIYYKYIQEREEFKVEANKNLECYRWLTYTYERGVDDLDIDLIDIKNTMTVLNIARKELGDCQVMEVRTPPILRAIVPNELELNKRLLFEKEGDRFQIAYEPSVSHEDDYKGSYMLILLDDDPSTSKIKQVF